MRHTRWLGHWVQRGSCQDGIRPLKLLAFTWKSMDGILMNPILEKSV